jgi:phosphatidylserine/phosphatidylglycerophosphate/cardiolipin synthase-like enzyme
MKRYLLKPAIAVFFLLTVNLLFAQRGPITISNIFFSNITKTSVTVNWTTDTVANGRVRWMISDSVNQPFVYTNTMTNTNNLTTHFITLFGLQPGKIYACQIKSALLSDSVLSPVLYFATQSNSSGKIKVYFNHSIDSIVSTGKKANGDANFHDLLKNRIDSATYSIDITANEFAKLPLIYNALIDAKNRGVKIRFVYDSKTNSTLVDSIISAGVPIIKRNFDITDGHCMNNNFWVFDQRNDTTNKTTWVWTGSANITDQHFYKHKNNILLIQDKSLAAAYTREFEIMWGSHGNTPNSDSAKFGMKKTDLVPHLFNIGGKPVELFFSPSDSTQRNFCRFIKKAERSISFCIYDFSSKSIEDSMKLMFNNDTTEHLTNIKGLFDRSKVQQAPPDNVFTRMKGIASADSWNPPADVFTDTTAGLLHHKYVVVNFETDDSAYVETGSYDFTTSSDRNNDENILIIYSPEIANQYYQEFAARYKDNTSHSLVVDDYPYTIKENQILVYPNPAVNNVTFSFVTATAGYAKITVYDLQGRTIAIISSTNMAAGQNNIKWNLNSVSAGTYIYRVETDAGIITGKIIKINP